MKIKNLVSNEIYQRFKDQVFHFMVCQPLVEEGEDGHIHKIKETQTRTTSFYNLNILKITRESDRQIVHKFPSMSRKNFYQILQDGCSFLNINFHYSCNQNMVYMNQNLKLEKESLQKIQQYFMNNPSKLGKILIILLGTKTSNYGQFFLELYKNTN